MSAHAPLPSPRATRRDVLIVRDHGFQQSPAVERYAQVLDTHGHSVVAFGWDREAKLPTHERRSHFDIERVRFFRATSRSKKVILGLLLWQWRVFWRALLGQERLVHACDFHSGPACRLATLLNRKPFIYDMRDPISGAFRLGLLRPILDRAERFFTNISDLVIVPHEERLRYVGARARATRTLVLYNSPLDRPDLHAGARPPLPPCFTPDNPLRINMCGHIHAERGVDALLALAARCEAVTLDAVGDPRNDALLKRLRDAPRVRYLEPVPNARAQELMAEAHLVASFYDPSIEINRLACSNKAYEAMMLGRPLLTNSGINVGDLVAREGIGFVVPFGDVDALERTIQRLIAAPSLLVEMGRRARQYFEQHVCCQRQAATYVNTVRALLGEPRVQELP